MKRLLTAAAVMLASATLPAQVLPIQTHLYVDAVKGSDGNLGNHPTRAFKSIKKALATLGSNVVVHVAPGSYGATGSGDTWPLKLGFATKCENVKLIGEKVGTSLIDMGTPSAMAPVSYAFKIRSTATGAVKGLEIRNLTFNGGKLGVAQAAIELGWYGGGKYSGGTDVNIHHCHFDNVSCGVILTGNTTKNVAIHDNVFTNILETQAIRICDQGSFYVYNNLVIGNQITAGLAGIEIGQGGRLATQAVVVNNIIKSCSGYAITGINKTATVYGNCAFNNHSGQTKPQYSVVLGATLSKSNLSADPMLGVAGLGVYALKVGSPCFDAGYPHALPFMVDDWYGNNRISDYDNDGFARPDIGVAESTRVRLELVRDWGMNRTPIFNLTGTPGYSCLIMCTFNRTSLLVQPVGLVGFHPTNSVVLTLASVPTVPNWAPFGKIPFIGDLYSQLLSIQGIGFKINGSKIEVSPTGRLDLYFDGIHFP